MAFYNGVLRDYSPDTENSTVLCRVWLCDVDQVKSLPKSWFVRWNGHLLKRSEVDKRLLSLVTGTKPLMIYCRPQTVEWWPLWINLEFIEGGTSGDGVQVEVEGGTSVEALKLKVEGKCGLVKERQRLIYGGDQLKNGRKLRDYGLKMGEVVYLVDRRGLEVDNNNREEKRGKEETCVKCDRRRGNQTIFEVDCGHGYHADCLGGGGGCVICEVDLVGWREALEMYQEEGMEVDTGKRRSFGREVDDDEMVARILQERAILEDQEEEIEEAIEAEEEDTLEGIQRPRWRRWLDFDEFYYFILAIFIPALVGWKWGNVWGGLAVVVMIEVMRKRMQGPRQP